jgi:uncharacterized protein (DUF1778 family)
VTRLASLRSANQCVDVASAAVQHAHCVNAVVGLSACVRPPAPTAQEYGKMPYVGPKENGMSVAARFDLKMDPDEKAVVAKAAALMGTTMAGFVRAAAKEKAQALLDREARLTLSERDFAHFARALDSAFTPNPALEKAVSEARRKVRRA